MSTKMSRFSAILALLFIIFATGCITIITLLITTPLQVPVVQGFIALPGRPEFSSENMWIDKVGDSLTAPPDVRATIINVLACVLAGVIILMIFLCVRYVRQHAPTKRQPHAFKRTCGEEGEWALTAPEEAWFPTHSDQGKEA
jgi:hypothetical protein